MELGVNREIIGIDPGPLKSAAVRLLFGLAVQSLGHEENFFLRGRLVESLDAARTYAVTRRDVAPPLLAVEDFSGFRFELGPSSFSTLKWIGRYQELGFALGCEVMLIERRAIKLKLCGSMKAKDGDIARAVRQRLGEPGTKKDAGPTYGVSGHCWQALAVAVVAAEILWEKGNG